MTTWRNLIDAERRGHDDGPLVVCTLSDEGMDLSFDDGFGGTEGAPFTAWSEARVYFPVQYDGAEWCASVPRDPNGEITQHVGGG